MFTPFTALIWLIFGAIATAIGAKKGQLWMGLALGVVLGIFGVIIMLFVKPSREHLIEQERVRLEAEAEARRRMGL